MIGKKGMFDAQVSMKSRKIYYMDFPSDFY